MTNNKISKRLLTIAQMVDKDSNIMDVGCDHALLDIYLLKNNMIKKSIASDINEGALNQAKKNLSKEKKYNIDLRLGPGLDVLNEKDKVDIIIMSGLGSKTIINILKDNKEKLKNINKLIIQSNKELVLLRKEVIKLGYFIENEKLVKENKKLYCIIKFSKGKRKYTRKEIYFGPILNKDKTFLYQEFYKNIYEKNKIIIKSIPSIISLRKIKLILINQIIKKEVR